MQAIETVGIMSPGDMGHAVAALLKRNGARVVTNLSGRSDRTRTLCTKAGIEDVQDDAVLLRESDIVLSIIVPDQAVELAGRLANAIRREKSNMLVVDCNAIAPETTKQIGSIINDAGGRFVDAGIVGPPPKEDGSRTKFYSSGPDVEEFAQLRRFGLEVRPVSDRVGHGSAVKMCYAALTKGSAALMTQLIVVAERLGVSDTVRAEFEQTQPEQLQRMRQWVPSSVPKAFRWVGEMEEIAKTFADAGVASQGFEAAAATFDSVAKTDLGQMRVEEWAEAGFAFEEVVKRLAREL